MRGSSFTLRSALLSLRRLAMSKVDKPDEVAFAKAVVENLPSQDDKYRQLIGLGAAYILSRAIHNARRR